MMIAHTSGGYGYEFWKSFSNLSHSNMKALSVRLTRSEPGQVEVHYFLRDAKVIGGSLFWILNAACEMESALYRCFVSRLRLDTVLEGMRTRVQRKKETVRREVIRRFGWKALPHIPPKTTE